MQLSKQHDRYCKGTFVAEPSGGAGKRRVCRALQMLVQLCLWPAIFACATCLGVIEAGLPAVESKGPESDLRTCWVLT